MMKAKAVSRELVMYSRTLGCPYISIAKRVLKEKGIPYRQIMIDKDAAARVRILQWTGFLSVPTLIVTDVSGELPYEEPLLLPKGESPRGINRGSMITEPNVEQLEKWLAQHGFIG